MRKEKRYWPCPHCAGVGQLPLSRELSDVLNALNAGGTLGDVRKHLNKPRTVVQNRLFRLMHMDLIERIRRRADGRGLWFYRPLDGLQHERRRESHGRTRPKRK